MPGYLLRGFREQHFRLIQDQVAEPEEQQALVCEQPQEALWGCDYHLTCIVKQRNRLKISDVPLFLLTFLTFPLPIPSPRPPFFFSRSSFLIELVKAAPAHRGSFLSLLIQCLGSTRLRALRGQEGFSPYCVVTCSMC